MEIECIKKYILAFFSGWVDEKIISTGGFLQTSTDKHEQTCKHKDIPSSNLTV